MILFLMRLWTGLSIEFIDVRGDSFWDSDDDVITVRANKKIAIDGEELMV